MLYHQLHHVQHPIRSIPDIPNIPASVHMVTQQRVSNVSKTFQHPRGIFQVDWEPPTVKLYFTWTPGLEGVCPCLTPNPSMALPNSHTTPTGQRPTRPVRACHFPSVNPAAPLVSIVQPWYLVPIYRHTGNREIHTFILFGSPLPVGLSLELPHWVALTEE